MSIPKISVNLPGGRSVSLDGILNWLNSGSGSKTTIDIDDLNIDHTPHTPHTSKKDFIIVKDASEPNYITIWKQKLTEPFSMLVIGSVTFLSYVYMANDFACQAVGLYYPSYQMSKTLNQVMPDKKEKLIGLLQYFIIYAHLEAISYPFKMLHIPLNGHAKFIILIYLIYLLDYRRDLLAGIYQKIRKIDNTALTYVNDAMKLIAPHLQSTLKADEKME